MDNLIHYTIASLGDTRTLAKTVVRQLTVGAMILLSGDLGAGKTTLVRDIVRFLLPGHRVPSPSFAILHEYLLPANKRAAPVRFIHIDTFRLKGAHEFRERGLSDYLSDPRTIIAIEWPERMSGQIKKYMAGRSKIIRISLRHAPQKNARLATMRITINHRRTRIFTKQ